MSRRREAFAFQVYQAPLPHDGKAFNIEDDEALGLQFQVNGYTRDQGDTQIGDDALFNGAVVAHMHTDLEGQAGLLKNSLQGSAGAGTLLTQQEMLTRQFCEGDLLTPGQAMCGSRDEDEFVGGKWFDDDGDFGRDGAHDGQVDAVVYEGIDQGGAIEDVQGDLDGGKAVAKGAEEVGDDVGADGGVGAYAEVACIWAAQCLHGFEGFVDDGEDFVAVEEEFFAGVGEVGSAADLVEELDAEGFFELAHLGGDGGLAEVQFFGCTDVAAVLCDRLKGGELMQVECAHEVAYVGTRCSASALGTNCRDVSLPPSFLTI